jgi:hypothetical protein
MSIPCKYCFLEYKYHGSSNECDQAIVGFGTYLRYKKMTNLEYLNWRNDVRQAQVSTNK